MFRREHYLVLLLTYVVCEENVDVSYSINAVSQENMSYIATS